MRTDEDTKAPQFSEQDLRDAGVEMEPGVFKVTADDVNLWLRHYARMEANHQRAKVSHSERNHLLR